MIWGKTSGANLGFLKVAFGDQFDPNSTLDEYIDFDIEGSIVLRKLTNQEILAEVNEIVEVDSDDEQKKMMMVKPFTKPEIEKVRKGLQIFEDCNVFGEAMLKALKNVNCSRDKDELCNKEQTFFSDFISKKWILKFEKII